MHKVCKLASHFGLFACPGNEQFDQVQRQFSEHVSAFGLSYGTKEEYEFRFNIYADNEKIINEHNASGSSFTLGHNKFSTYTDAEYKKLLGLKVP